jgi:hypothetical protein
MLIAGTYRYRIRLVPKKIITGMALHEVRTLTGSVADPVHFCVAPDPAPAPTIFRIYLEKNFFMVSTNFSAPAP